jgi:glycosyltransferase 2 family protein
VSSSRLRSIVQYIFIFGLTIALVWYSLRGIQGEQNKWDYLQNAWAEADKGWLMLMAVVAITSHAVRALRWKMLMVASGHVQQNFSHSFLSLMVGYFINLLIPRGGELSRCFNLYKLNRTPVEMSFGTVIVERIVDVICLLILIIISFVLESRKLFAFIDTLPIGMGSGESRLYILLIVAVVAIVVGWLAYRLILRNEKARDFIVRKWAGFKEGLLSVFRLKDKKLFIFYSVLIWTLYFFMSYTVIMAFEATSVLGWSAVLSLFAVGAIAMAAPLPGGTGSYHLLVPQSLVFLYHVPQADAVAFTFIFHGWQTVIMIIGGAISLIVTTILIRKNARPS